MKDARKTANRHGLSLSSANHGAFLIQLTTLIVPIVQAILGVLIPKRIWLEVGLAVIGVFLFMQDAGSKYQCRMHLVGEKRVNI